MLSLNETDITFSRIEFAFEKTRFERILMLGLDLFFSQNLLQFVPQLNKGNDGIPWYHECIDYAAADV